MTNYNFPNNYSQNMASSLNTINSQIPQQNQNLQSAQMPQQNQMPQQQLFLQSQGNLYMINNPLEISNVPVGTGLSAAISFSEGLLYLKSMQNGIPMVIGYKLSPIENINSQNKIETKENNKKDNVTESKNATEILQDYDKRLQKIEQLLQSNKEGEKLQWQV